MSAPSMTRTPARAKMNTKVMVSMAMLTGIAYIVMLASKLMEIKEREHLDKISDTLIQKLSMIITDAKYTVDTMELCYYPYKIQDEEYELTATWILDILEELPSGESSRFQMAIDAFTAEELFS